MKDFLKFKRDYMKYIFTGFIGFFIIIALFSFISLLYQNQENNLEFINETFSEVTKESCDEGTIWTQRYQDGSFSVITLCSCINNQIICQNATSEIADEFLLIYKESVDKTCTTNEDCAIKDIRSCCQEYPTCTNINFNPKPKLVQDLCEVSNTMPVCGYPTINNCECIDGICQGTL